MYDNYYAFPVKPKGPPYNVLHVVCFVYKQSNATDLPLTYNYACENYRAFTI
jgi:hypothetical protein